VEQHKETMMAKSRSSARGFAAMDKDKQRAIASKGGKASHGSRGKSQSGGGTRGGSPAQHARAGRQSHKNR
jgi:general stress protein YciG